MSGKTCAIVGCDSSVVGRGWCKLHWQRWQRYGDPAHIPDRLRPVEERFVRQVAVGDLSDCWPWTGCIDLRGYGRITIAGKNVATHRWAYEHAIGPIPDGLVIDHLCHNAAAAAGECRGGDSCAHRRCVNPTHLEPVTLTENTAASPITPSSINRRRTHCVNGHEFTPENTRERSDGRGRACVTCTRRSSRESAYRRYHSQTTSNEGAVR